jgi:hypothetical protein
VDAANTDLSRTKARLSASDIELQVCVFPGLVQAHRAWELLKSVSVVSVVRICANARSKLRAVFGAGFAALWFRSSCADALFVLELCIGRLAS